MSLNNLLKLLSMMLFILCLMTYFMPPVEGQQILSNITDLLSSAFMNQTTTPLNNTAVTAAFSDYTPLNNTDMATVLSDTTQAMDAQIPGMEATSANPWDPFPGVSRAIPGTFMKMVQKWYLRMLSSATTPATWTTPMTSSSSTVANAAGTVGMSSMLSGFIFLSWMVGVIFTTWK